jgi:hypothetical protein
MSEFNETNPEEITSTVQESPVIDMETPPGVAETVELYEAAVHYYTAASDSYDSSVTVIASTSAVSPWR